MAKYRLTSSAYVEGAHTFATPQYPVILELEDDIPPSRTWEPLDEGAVKALAKLGVKKTVAGAPQKAAAAPSPAPAPAPRRPSDKEAL
jgi:hypothetical protein